MSVLVTTPWIATIFKTSISLTCLTEVTISVVCSVISLTLTIGNRIDCNADVFPLYLDSNGKLHHLFYYLSRKSIQKRHAQFCYLRLNGINNGMLCSYVCQFGGHFATMLTAHYDCGWREISRAPSGVSAVGLVSKTTLSVLSTYGKNKQYLLGHSK